MFEEAASGTSLYNNTGTEDANFCSASKLSGVCANASAAQLELFRPRKTGGSKTSWLHHTILSSESASAQWVDDVPFRAIGTPDTIKTGIARSVVTSRNMLKDLGLVLATKTTITATEMAIAGDIQKELRLRRINLQVESGRS